MKRLFAVLSVLSLAILLVNCKSAEQKKRDQMAGIYRMMYQSFKGESLDTTITTGQQLKIFSGEYMMYTRFNPVDSSSSFGIGTYNTEKDTVTEHIMFTAADSVTNATTRTYSLIIKKTDSGYIQVIPRIEGNNGDVLELTEEYNEEDPGEETPLEGIWHLKKRYTINGTDTTMLPAWNQYKAYQNNHFLWGNAIEDSTGRIRTAIGFGHATVTGDGMIKESGIASSLKEVAGNDFDIKYTMDGKDKFTQHIANDDGSISVEVYERLNKNKI
ncbi:MAG TPA: hypothetical protein PLU37_14525 [Chitinophagaceae bacterium]|nr:hypothetical protein [Chitinophagaceae bacterium]